MEMMANLSSLLKWPIVTVVVVVVVLIVDIVVFVYTI
jgi:hypothetical protein